VQLIKMGSAWPLGATWTKSGVNFAVFSSGATRVEVAIFDAVGGSELARYDLPGRTGDIWHGQLSPRRAGPGAHYAFYMHGPNEPQNGRLFDPRVALIDPYALELSTGTPLRSRWWMYASTGAAIGPRTSPGAIP
jgi:pullulanase/glycogen debranching enzyme